MTRPFSKTFAQLSGSILVALATAIVLTCSVMNAIATDTLADHGAAEKPFDLKTFETIDALTSELRVRLPVRTTRQSVDALLVETGGATVERNPDEANVYHYRHEFLAPAIQQDWRWNITVQYDDAESVDQIWVNGSAVHRDRLFIDGKLE